MIAPKSFMVPLLAQKAGLDDKVKVFVLYVEPITDMIDKPSFVAFAMSNGVWS